MISWFTSWFYTESVIIGPGRGFIQGKDGKEMKAVIAANPKQFLMVTPEEINTIRNNLRKTKINDEPAPHFVHPMIQQLHDVLQNGNDQYFLSLKQTV
jgi:hypothetical protein